MIIHVTNGVTKKAQPLPWDGDMKRTQDKTLTLQRHTK